MAGSSDFVPRPSGYKPPDYAQVQSLAWRLREERQGKLDKINLTKQAIRGNWEDVLAKIPRAYRKVQPSVDLPEIRDMLRRIVGQIAGQELIWEVTPPSYRQDDVKAASAEEARLKALAITIEDQQDESVFGLGIDAQCSWGESWISVWPDPSRLEGADFKRGADESPKDYKARYGRAMADGRVPIVHEVHDPQTVLPRFSRNRLALVVFQSEHTSLDINLGLGYHPVKDTQGKTYEWTRATLSEPYVSADLGPTLVVDPSHDSGTSSSAPSTTVKSLIYVDAWVYQRYLDSVLVEEWEHNYGMVPVFPGWGIQSSDRDPAYHSVGIIDTALVVARQIIYYSAVMAANALQHGWPTPFLKNPDHGLVHPTTLKPLTREIVIGEVNLLGPNEEIVFPYLDAKMMPDFLKHMEFLTRAFEGSTLGSFGNVNSDTSGYAVAQVRALKDALLGPLYRSTARQWRKIGYFHRHIVKTNFPNGIFLRGAVDTVEVDGQEVQYRPVLEYSKEHCTDFAINAHINEGIVQDEIAERKSALEMLQAQVWSPRRVMEKTGVDDPAAELEEISVHRMMNSPAADQVVMQMAMAMAAERYQASRTDMSSPFMQELSKAQQELLNQGQNAAGLPANQEAQPGNAHPGGQPVQQNPPPAAPQQGGPGAGAKPGTGTNLNDMGIPQLPGGVAGGQVPAAAGV